MTSDRPIDKDQTRKYETSSTGRVILAPWIYIFRPGIAAETMVTASASSFVISYLCGCAVLMCVNLLTIFTIQAGWQLVEKQQIVYLVDLMKSVLDTWDSWATTGALSRSITNSAMICVIAVVLNLLLAWFKWPSLLRADQKMSSFDRAFRCTAAGLGFVTLLVLATVSIFAAYVYVRLSLNPRTYFWRFSQTPEISALLVFASLCLLLFWVSKAEYHLVSMGDTIELPPLCEGCGYDLTHQSSEGKCTECGLALDESLSPHKRRTGCDWELLYRAPVFAFFETTVDCLRNLGAFYESLKLRTPVDRASKFVAMHYILLGIASGGWFFFVLTLMIDFLKFDLSLLMAGRMMLMAPLLGWIGIHFVGATVTTWWMANRMLPDPSVVRKVLAYETSVLWLFYIFSVALLSSLYAYGDWVSKFVGRAFFFGMPMEMFFMFFGSVLLGILSFLRFHRALMAVRWANF